MQLLYDLLTSVTPDTFNKVVLALVAVVVMGIQLWLAKKQLKLQMDVVTKQVDTQQAIASRQAIDNVSSKRQQWIDELRKDLAEQLALLTRIIELWRPNSGISVEDKKKVFDEQAAALLRINELAHLIRLRLNPNEQEHIELLARLKELTQWSGQPPVNETAEQRKTLKDGFLDCREKAIQQAQVVLKKEWERVKNGKL